MVFITAAASEILAQYFTLPHILSVTLIFAVIVTLTYLGRRAVELSMVYSVIALIITLVWTVYTTFSAYGDQISSAFQTAPLSFAGVPSGFQYAVVQLGFFPLLLFAARGLKTRGETFISSLSTAGIIVLPATFIHIILQAAFQESTAQSLPLIALAQKTLPEAGLVCLIFTLFVMITQSGVGLLQGVIERLETTMQHKYQRSLSKGQHGLIAAGLWVISMGLSSVGLVTVIVSGYSLGAFYLLCRYSHDHAGPLFAFEK